MIYLVVSLAIGVPLVAAELTTREELGLSDGVVYRSWLFLIRFVVPVAIGCMLVFVFL